MKKTQKSSVTPSKIMTGPLSDSWQAEIEELQNLATESVRADVRYTEAVQRRVTAEAEEKRTLAEKTKAEKALTRARSRLGVNLP